MLTIRLIGGGPANKTAIDQRLGLDLMDAVLVLVFPDRSLLTHNSDAGARVIPRIR